MLLYDSLTLSLCLFCMWYVLCKVEPLIKRLQIIQDDMLMLLKYLHKDEIETLQIRGPIIFIISWHLIENLAKPVVTY